MQPIDGDTNMAGVSTGAFASKMSANGFSTYNPVNERRESTGLMLSNISSDGSFSIVDRRDQDPFMNDRSTYPDFDIGHAVYTLKSPPSPQASTFTYTGEVAHDKSGKIVTLRTGFTPLLKTQDFDKLQANPERVDSVLKKKVVLHAYSKEQAEFLENALSEDSDYEIEVVKRFECSETERENLSIELPLDSKNPNTRTKIILKIRPSVAATTFHGFPLLPKELQLKIWKHTMPDARTLRLHVSEELDRFPILYPNSVPAILQVCHLARTAALKDLVPAFPSNVHQGAYAYFNPAIDTLKLSLTSARRLAMVKVQPACWDREHTKNIEISFVIKENDANWETIAELVLLSPHRAWPCVQTWYFPGKGRENKPKPARKARCEVVIKRYDEKASNSENTIAAVAKVIGDAFKAARNDFGEDTQIGVLITYDGPPVVSKVAVVKEVSKDDEDSDEGEGDEDLNPPDSDFYTSDEEFDTDEEDL